MIISLLNHAYSFSSQVIYKCRRKNYWNTRLKISLLKRSFGTFPCPPPTPTRLEDITPKTVATFNEQSGYQAPLTKENAFQIAQKLYPHLPVIILVNPYLDQNVGSVARAMLNHGLTQLRVVNPRCNILSADCEALSCGAFDIVKNAQVYDNLNDCLQDFTTVYATSDRVRELSQIVVTPEVAASQCIQFTKEYEVEGKEGSDQRIDDVNNEERKEKIGIMFGRETLGLFNEELILANYLIKIPTFNHFSSLNLAQAVNLIGYEIFKKQNQIDNTYPPNEWLEVQDKKRVATRQDVEAFLNRLLSILDTKWYEPTPGMRNSLYRKIKGIFYRIKLAQTEVSVLQGIVSALLGKHQHKFDREEERRKAADLTNRVDLSLQSDNNIVAKEVIDNPDPDSLEKIKSEKQ